MEGNYFVVRKSADGQYYFYYRAGNGEIVATSETYRRKQSALDGLETIRRNAASASVVDMTEE